MRVFVDESGCFSTKNNDVSVMATLIYPEYLDYKIEKFFKKVYPTLSTDEKDAQGEMKGYALSNSNLKKVFEFISRNRDIKITFDVFDTEIHSQSIVSEFRKGQGGKFQQALDKYMKGPVKAKAMQEDLLRLKRWAESKKKISDQDYLQIVILTRQLQVTIQKALVYYSNRKYAKSFEKFEFVFDNKSSKKMLSYINDALPGFLDSRASGEGLVEIQGTVYEGHPLRKYVCEIEGGIGAYDIGKIFTDGVIYGDSKKYYGIQLADVVASNIRSIILGKRPSDLFDLIRFNCAYFKERWLPFQVMILDTQERMPLDSLSRRKVYNFLQKPASRGWSKVPKPDYL